MFYAIGIDYFTLFSLSEHRRNLINSFANCLPNVAYGSEAADRAPAGDVRKTESF